MALAPEGSADAGIGDAMPANMTKVRQGRNRAEVAEQAARAYELRLRGHTVAEVARELGCSTATVTKRVEEFIAQTVLPQADRLRRIETDRLDELWRRAWEILEAEHPYLYRGEHVVLDDQKVYDSGPKLAAMDRLLRIMERRAKLLGLDMPAKVEVQAPPDPAEIELRSMIQAAKQKMRLEEEALRRGDEA